MLKEFDRLPIVVINAPGLEEGFYRDLTHNSIFYLSKKNEGWLFQYSMMSQPQALEYNFPKIYAQKIEPEQFLRLIGQEQRFIESKLDKISKTKRR